jgi:pyruvate formate lyase activating enzyme
LTFGVKGFDQMSLVDWDGMVAATVYLPGCNFRCPYCHNSGLVLLPDQYETISLDEIVSYIGEHNDFLDGIVLTGGEPCIHSQLPELTATLRGLGVRIKLDTNGSYPDMLEELARDELVDYVAMDIKGPLDLEAYARCAGMSDRRTLERVKGSVDFLMDGEIEYEFRTTVVPALHRATDLERIAEQLAGARRFVIQNYVPRDTLNPDFLNEAPYDGDRLDEFKEIVSKRVEQCSVRGV